jgi:hypothetical protein
MRDIIMGKLDMIKIPGNVLIHLPNNDLIITSFLILRTLFKESSMSSRIYSSKRNSERL